jgi:hypothetical protein
MVWERVVLRVLEAVVWMGELGLGGLAPGTDVPGGMFGLLTRHALLMSERDHSSNSAWAE